jgi:hypothetical protein
MLILKHKKLGAHGDVSLYHTFFLDAELKRGERARMNKMIDVVMMILMAALMVKTVIKDEPWMFVFAYALLAVYIHMYQVFSEQAKAYELWKILNREKEHGEHTITDLLS